MPPTTKITVEQEGEPSVTLHIDPAEPPVSLGDLLKRAKAARGMPETNYTGYEDQAAIPKAMHRVVNTAALRAILSRLWQGKLAKAFDNAASIPVFRNEWPALGEVLEYALMPPLFAPGSLSEDDLKELSQPGGVMAPKPDPESDLEDVLDSYRLAGKLCGLQVFAVDHVVCWTGDIEDTGLHDSRFQIRSKPVPYPPTFHQARGANALEDAAKWLREQLDPGRFNTSYNLEGLSRSDGSGENITESRE